MVEKKNAKVESIAKDVMKEKKLLNGLLEDVSSDEAAVKYESLKALMLISEQQPKILYPEWSFFVKLLDADNTFLRVIGATIIANLTRVDVENKFEEIFNRYYSLLEDESMINAANIAGRSGIIAKAKPHLQDKITNKLLDIDKTRHSLECKNIIKGKAILSFDEYIDMYNDKEKIIRFVRNELENSRSATRKKAEKFIKRWAK